MDLKDFGRKCGRIGLVLSVLSAILYAASQGAANLIKETVTPEMILVTRYFLHSIPLLPFLLLRPQSLVLKNKWDYVLLMLGGTFKGLESLCTYYSYQYIPLLDSMVLANSQPIFVAVISFIWLKEAVGLHEVFALIIATVGVILVCEPTFIFGADVSIDHSNRLIGSGIALLSALYTALCTCITRKLFDVDLYVIIYSQGIMSVLSGFILGMATETLVLPKSWDAIVIMIIVGVLGVFSRIFITQSLKTEDATIVSVLQSLRIPLIFAFQWAIIGTPPSLLATVGAVFVTVSSILLSLKEAVGKLVKRPVREIKKRCCCKACKEDEEEDEDEGEEEDEEEEPLVKEGAEVESARQKKKRLESFYTSLEM